MSVLALAVDRLDVIRLAQGEAAVRTILTQVARAVRQTAASIGMVAASYRNGMITVVAPELGAAPARSLGESIHNAVARLGLANSEAIAADHLTASVAVATGHVRSGIDRVDLLTRALASAQGASAAGGNRVIAANG
jgi:PleD family two-component response regulator